MQAIHSRHAPSAAPRFDGKSAGPFAAVHPLVRVHPETGTRSLLVSAVFMQAIRGLKPRESTALLDFLLDELAGRDEIHARVRWERDTLVMWDNRAVAHAGPVDGLMFQEERIVHRTTVVGDLPCGPDGFVSRALMGAGSRRWLESPRRDAMAIVRARPGAEFRAGVPRGPFRGTSSMGRQVVHVQSTR